jgi:hypothetical protein
LADINLVLKGGVTSGLVYGGAIPPLASRYRFRAVAVSSAGAIAAAFTAAAEFARGRGDPAGFERLQAVSEGLPGQLKGFFQPARPFRRLMRALVLLAPGTGRARWLAALVCFWPVMLIGALAGAALSLGLSGAFGPPSPVAAVLAAFLGGVAALAGHGAWLLFAAAPRHNFGICSGLSQGEGPGLTDWLHDSLQTIAFGAAGRAAPLTFGDLSGEGHPIDLRILVTNLTEARPEVTPDLGQGLAYRPADWRRLFPTAVMDHLGGSPSGETPPFPRIADLPVLVAVRMSLSCPALMQAVPALDAGGRRVWFSDGGLTTNFPFEVFEREPQDRETLALDLDTMHPGEAAEARVRAFDPAAAVHGPDIGGLPAFVWAVLVALREGHLRGAARAPALKARIYQAGLRPDEGGMNLAMTPDQARNLVQYGQALAAHVLEAEARLGR